MRKAILKVLHGALISLIVMIEEGKPVVSVMIEEGKPVVPGKELILGLFAQTVTENVKSRSSPAQAVRYIARNAFQSAKETIYLTQAEIVGPKKEMLPGNAVPIKDRLQKGQSPLKRKSHLLCAEKNMLN